jgi:hypothetical protein
MKDYSKDIDAQELIKGELVDTNAFACFFRSMKFAAPYLGGDKDAFEVYETYLKEFLKYAEIKAERIPEDKGRACSEKTQKHIYDLKLGYEGIEAIYAEQFETVKSETNVILARCAKEMNVFVADARIVSAFKRRFYTQIETGA